MLFEEKRNKPLVFRLLLANFGGCVALWEAAQKLVPAGFGRDDRCVSSDRPGAGDRRFQAEATFIEEDQGRALLDLFFPTRGASAQPKFESPAHRVPGHAVLAFED